MNSTLSLFFKIPPMYRQTAGKPLPSQALTSLSHQQVPIQGQWLNTSTGKTVQAEIYTQQDGRMLSSLQGGRKETPLVVRKEA